MKILLGSDVDPVLPETLRRAPEQDIWRTLDLVPALLDRMGSKMPPVTWLIRADESVCFATGDFDSGFTSRARLWERLLQSGHEIGWHMHLLSFDEQRGCFAFDPNPPWLGQALESLTRRRPISATRTGWDYADARLLRTLDGLGIRLDFSALPGNRVWPQAGGKRFVVDWLGCGHQPFHPSVGNHQQTGKDALDLIELPIPSSAIRRLAA